MKRLALFLAIGLAGLNHSAFATGFIEATACPTASIGQYVASFGAGGSICQINGVGYSDFYFADITGFGSINSSELIVTPDLVNHSFSLLPVDEFVLNGNFVNFERYYFAWYIDPPPIIAGDELTLDPPNAFVTATKYMCPDSIFSTSNSFVADTVGTGALTSENFNCLVGDFLAPKYFIQAAAPDPLSGSVTFDTPAATVDVRLFLDLGPGTIEGFRGIVQELPLTTDVPEPGTNAMIAAGLAAVVAYSKKKLKR